MLINEVFVSFGRPAFTEVVVMSCGRDIVLFLQEEVVVGDVVFF